MINEANFSAQVLTHLEPLYAPEVFARKLGTTFTTEQIHLLYLFAADVQKHKKERNGFEDNPFNISDGILDQYFIDWSKETLGDTFPLTLAFDNPPQPEPEPEPEDSE